MTDAALPPAAKVKRARKPQAPIENLTGLLDRLCSLVECQTVPAETVEKVTIRAVLDTIGRRAYGPLLLFLGVFAVSPLTAVPGLTWATAGLTLVIAGQLALGLQKPWLPGGVQNIAISSSALVTAVKALRPTARWVDAVLKPRWQFMSQAPFVILVGLLICAAALVTFPLGFIPFAPLIPGVGIVLFALGLVAKDGVLLALVSAASIGVGAWGFEALWSATQKLLGLG
jgi:hypothetical protein